MKLKLTILLFAAFIAILTWHQSEAQLSRGFLNTNGFNYYGYRLIANYENGTQVVGKEYERLALETYEQFLDKIDTLINQGAISVTIEREAVTGSAEPEISLTGLKGLSG